MNVRRWVMAVNLAGALVVGGGRVGTAQCCLNDLFAGFHSCFYRAPQAYAVAPVAAPMMAPAPIPARAWEIQRRLSIRQRVTGYGQLLEHMPVD